MFPKNPNETNYSGGKKHWADVIKNTGSGDLLIWLNGEEDFNTNSTLIVAESEEALFFKDGVIEQVFDGGKYSLSTHNYPFISRIRNAFTGGISTFNCKVYFVRKAHSLELLWGTDTPIQMRDPKYKLQTSISARGSYSIQVDDSKKFLLKLVGNNIIYMTRDELNHFFRSAFLQTIKSNIARVIKEADEEILGICAQQDLIAEKVTPTLRDVLNEYGIRLVNFYIKSIDIPENDPNRAKLEEAYANKNVMNILGDDWGKQQATDILKKVAEKPGPDGLAGAGMGLGMGMATGTVMGNMAQQMFTPMSNNLVEKSSGIESIKCPNCGALQSVGKKYCNECGSKIPSEESVCKKCGAKLKPGSKFCNECGEKIEDKGLICTNCGAQLDQNAKFCNDCGTKVN